MKYLFFLLMSIILNNFSVAAQQISDREKAKQIAKEDFSKSKHVKKEKYGIVKEVNKDIVSEPVVMQDTKAYAGLYKAQDVGYLLELSINGKEMQATLKKPEEATSYYQTFPLEHISIKDALFRASLTDSSGAEQLEGVFMNKNDNGAVDLGLGIKLPKSITLDGLTIDKLFFKKVQQN